MRVYFVRHGESIENTTRTYIGAHVELTEEGRAQAGFVANRFLKIPLDIILSSDMERAKKTALAVSEKVSIGVTHSELLRELSAPSEFIGKDPEDPETKALLEKWLAHRKKGDGKKPFSDEETLPEAKERAKKALSYITAHEENDILVVTHGTFLRVMVLTMLESRLDVKISIAKHFEDFRNFISISNTGITVCDYNDGAWRLITLNDHAHLG